MNTLFYVSIAMIAGLLFTRVTRLIKLPNVTAYLIAGVVIGPCVTNLLTNEACNSLSLINEAALGFIAFSIGDQFKLSSLKAIGKPALVITILEAFGAVVFTMSITLLLGFDPVICIMLGALSASTAPAATLLIVRQYKASGPLITYNARNIRIKNIPIVSILSPIVCNGIIIGAQLAYVYTPNAFWLGFLVNGLQVALGEAIACIVLYPLLLKIVSRIDFNKYN